MTELSKRLRHAIMYGAGRRALRRAGYRPGHRRGAWLDRGYCGPELHWRKAKQYNRKGMEAAAAHLRAWSKDLKEWERGAIVL